MEVRAGAEKRLVSVGEHYTLNNIDEHRSCEDDHGDGDGEKSWWWT